VLNFRLKTNLQKIIPRKPLYQQMDEDTNSWCNTTANIFAIISKEENLFRIEKKTCINSHGQQYTHPNNITIDTG
jgi:hypothetical protein